MAVLLAATVLFAASLAFQSSPSLAYQDVAADEAVLSIWRVTVTGDADVATLLDGGYDLMESRGSNYLLVLGDQAVADHLREQGFTVEQDRALGPLPPLGSSNGDIARRLSYYGGYRTVVEHDAHLAQVAADFPDLATLYDYGDSWLKVNDPGAGNDLFAICLTDKQPGDCALNPNSAKPRAVVMAAIHARELQTAEVAWRLIDLLTTEFGNDPDITHILETTEVWVIPVANPDGREIVEGGGNTPYMQRKNANDSQGNCAVPPTSFDHHGVDLNRNADHRWGGAGTSTNVCAQTWPGVSPASEPELTGLQDLFDQLWLDQKGGPDDPAPTTTTGTFITLHSYGDLILIPTGEDGPAPNSAGMNAWAFRMSHYNNYVTGPTGEVLYSATGTTDDYVYFTLGVPSVTYEISPRQGICSGFAPIYSCVDSVLWPLNRDALLYSLKVAGAPYLESRGPTTDAVTVDVVDDALRVVATTDDDAYGDAAGSIGRPTPSTIAEARYYVDTPPSAGGTAQAMLASDAAFDELAESIEADINTAGLASGEHTVYVQARNAAGFWGPITATSFVLEGTGDVNLDGVVDNLDRQAVLQHLVGLTPEVFDEGAADVDNDGSIDLLDALLMSLG